MLPFHRNVRGVKPDSIMSPDRLLRHRIAINARSWAAEGTLLSSFAIDLCGSF